MIVRIELALLAVGLLIGATLSAPATDVRAQAQPSPSPAARPSPSPAAKPAGVTPVAESGPFTGAWVTPALTALAAVLIVLGLIAWYMSNRAEATPNPEQLAEIGRFVEGDFARYVARGLAASDGAGAGAGSGGAAARAEAPNIASDEAWRRVFLHQLDLHTELSRLSRRTALRVYEERVDAAVRRELAGLRGTGPDAPPAATD
jgi:hypothetical protein